MFLACALTFFPSRAVGSRPLSRKEIGSPARERLATTAFVFPHCRGPLSLVLPCGAGAYRSLELGPFVSGGCLVTIDLP